MSRQMYLGKVLYLTTDPQSKNDKKSDGKGNQENRLDADKGSSINNFNGAIIECTLVWLLFYLINNGSHKIECSGLK